MPQSIDEIQQDLTAQEQAQIDSERTLLHAVPPAGSRHPPKLRRPLPDTLDDWRLADAIRFMESSMADSVRMTAVAAHINLSPYHFQRYFKETMGETPASYVRRVKLDQAALSLLINDRQVIEIALGAGYGSHEAFVRAFFRQFGLVPTQYRVYARQAASQPRPEDLARAKVVRVRQRQHVPLLAMRFYGSYANVEMHWQKFAATLRAAGVQLDGLQAIGVAHDSPEITPNELIRYDCAIVDPGADTPCSALTALTFPTDIYASFEHHAPYDEIFDTYRILRVAWLASNAQEYAVEVIKAYELYREPPWENHGSAQRFDLLLPVIKVT
jgi:AraC family transcriptional regulator